VYSLSDREGERLYTSRKWTQSENSPTPCVTRRGGWDVKSLPILTREKTEGKACARGEHTGRGKEVQTGDDHMQRGPEAFIRTPSPDMVRRRA